MCSSAASCRFTLSCIRHHHRGLIFLDRNCSHERPAFIPSPSPWHSPCCSLSLNLTTLGTACHLFFLFCLDVIKHCPAHPLLPYSVFVCLVLGSGVACQYEEQEPALIYSLISISKSSPAQVTTMRIISGI